MKTALVTGASQGIGAALARMLAEHNYDLILVSRFKDPLETFAESLRQAYNTRVTTIVCDLSETETIEKTFTPVFKEHTVDVLINNAGFGVAGSFSETNLADETNMMRVNTAAMVILTKLALPSMLARKRGKILNVASTAAFQPGPGMAIYYATKAFVLSFSEAIAEELKDSGVTVTTLCPGPTKTGFAKRANMLQSNLFSRENMMSAEEVASIGYQGMVQGKSVVVTGVINGMGAYAARLFPRRWVFRIMKGLHVTQEEVEKTSNQV